MPPFKRQEGEGESEVAFFSAKRWESQKLSRPNRVRDPLS